MTRPPRTLNWPSSLSRLPLARLPLAICVLVLPIAVSCGGTVDEASTTKPAATASTTANAHTTIQAAKAAGTVDTKYFQTVLPEGWEVLADDIDAMGLMTLAEKGTGGAHGVYMKFEPGFSGDPMAKIQKMASKYEGTPAASSVRNGITWASTRYTYSGVTQTMNMTSHGGFKVTFTTMGADYSADPGVRAIFDGLTLK